MDENTKKQELIISFAKKGFLLDRESLDFFGNLEDSNISEEILNKIFLLTKSRIISKKILNIYFEEIEYFFEKAGKTKERQELIYSFFKEASEKKGKKEEIKVKEELKKDKSIENRVKIISSEIIPYRKIEVKDFITHFKNRYNFFKEGLKDRKELTNLISINKIPGNRSFSIIALVSSKRITKNKNMMLEVEDLTGKVTILITAEKEELFKKAREIVLDEVIGLRCSGGGEISYCNDIIFLDNYITEKRRAEEEVYALFISDMHLGSKLFLENNFLKFLDWINGKSEDVVMKEKAKKIRYIFIAGDNVDGVGIYPGQEPLLAITDLNEQYKKLAEYLKMLPENIKIIMCPGQHDSVRVPEPQPAIEADFAPELCEMKNVFLVSNPATLEIEGTDKKKGIRVLMYHGASMIRNWIDEIDELKISKAHQNPSKIVKYMLRHRHLSPTHSSNVYVPSEKEDTLIIKEAPDIMVTGDLHKADIDIYNNTLIICCSCWQTITPFEEKVGNQPDPCKVPMLNLKTREIKILDFS